ncbi:MAG: xylanase [Bacteroidales bacterium]|nr:xylanase [Bacteroidales bacterium]
MAFYILIACKSRENTGNDTPSEFPQTAVADKVYTVNAAKTSQTIDNFGASDCWTAQFFGHFPDDKRNRMADWLFSMDTDNSGQPKGIGLSLWRFNIGAGSAEQGIDGGIADKTRRAECFLLPDGSYDWSKCGGQRWFLQAARQRGVQQFLAFNLSPPVYMTLNGRANNNSRSRNGTLNLKADKYEAFADFLATVVAELGQREGISFQYLSPFNEPEWDWDGNNQEGTPALMSEIARTVRLLDAKMTEKGINTKIMLTESGNIDYLYRKTTDKNGRNNQIETFFNPASENCIAGLTHVPSMVAGHSYWTASPYDSLQAKRRALRKKLDKYDLGYWQTELCIMSSDTEIGGGGGKDLTMKTALYVARIIHYDLCVANASAWQWWLGMTNSNYKDGLVYVTPNAELTDGTLSDSKLMWTVGNFSRFVRPGAVRIDVSSEQANPNDPAGLMVSAFIHHADRQVTLVLVNTADKAQSVQFKLTGVKVNTLVPYVTSDAEGDNLSPKSGHDAEIPWRIEPKSVTTLVGKY